MESSLRRKCNQNLAEIIGQASLFWMLHSHTNYERTQVPPPMAYPLASQKCANYPNLQNVLLSFKPTQLGFKIPLDISIPRISCENLYFLKLLHL